MTHCTIFRRLHPNLHLTQDRNKTHATKQSWFDGDPALLSGYVGKSGAFDEAIEKFALAYAEQNEAGWTVLKAAVKAGRIQVIRQRVWSAPSVVRTPHLLILYGID
ncbi:DUF2252 family protein [Paraburkholderia sp. RL18-103-BIB-C]|uniref:DUF2252 family protein n=1 Tax=unclassified Paraburkholderia TaxID=2615204 RepID=UPI0038B6F6FA